MLDDLLAARGMTFTQLPEQVWVTIVNLSILKNGRPKAIRFSTPRSPTRALACCVHDFLPLAGELGLTP